jgi:hypothetical protein
MVDAQEPVAILTHKSVAAEGGHSETVYNRNVDFAAPPLLNGESLG